MAKLTVQEKIIKTYILELDEEEASFIHALTGTVVGSGKYRNLSDSLWNKFRDEFGFDGVLNFNKHIASANTKLKEVN